MSVAMYPGAIPLTWTFSLLHSLLRAFVSCPSAPFAAAYAGTVNPPCGRASSKARERRDKRGRVSACREGGRGREREE